RLARSWCRARACCSGSRRRWPGRSPWSRPPPGSARPLSSAAGWRQDRPRRVAREPWPGSRWTKRTAIPPGSCATWWAPCGPPGRLRARRQVVELRAADLRFTADEAAAFLREVMGLDLAPAEVAALEERTEGWIAGLQLAALSLRDQPDTAQFIAAFAGSNRY